MDGLLRALIKTVRRRLRADEEVTVEAVTKELGYTRQYISGRFHRITGRLLSQFLLESFLLAVPAAILGLLMARGGLALLITAAITFPAGKKLNATERLHTLFWMPMQWWAVILGVFGVLVIFGNR